MSLKAQIENDLKAALLERRRFDADILRGLKAVILNEEVAQGRRDEGLDDESIQKLIAKEVKKRVESAELYDKADRKELADNERAEIKVIELYLPEQASDDEIKAAIKDAIEQLGVTSAADMGRLIGAVKSKLGNSADGGLIARLVKEALS